MPFPMKIQPIDIDYQTPREPIRTDSAKPVLKTRLKRLFDRQFRVSAAADKPTTASVEGVLQDGKDGGTAVEFEPSSVCLDKLVRNFIEESTENKQPAAKCGRNRCSNCFNGNNNDSSDDEFDVFGESLSGGSFGDACDALKSLIPCASVAERNLLADTAKIVEKNKSQKQSKDDLRRIVTEALSSLGYHSSICKSKWDKSPSFPAGEYEYIDVVTSEGERLLIDIDFRSEFEIARSTGTYRAILQSLPYIFVGKPDRLQQMVSIVSEAAKQSLKKKGMHIPPWRKVDYMRAKWLSPYTRASTAVDARESKAEKETRNDDGDHGKIPGESEEAAGSDCVGEFELIFGEESLSPSAENSRSTESLARKNPGEKIAAAPTWQPPAVKPKSVDRRVKTMTGLASLLREKP